MGELLVTFTEVVVHLIEYNPGHISTIQNILGKVREAIFIFCNFSVSIVSLVSTPVNTMDIAPQAAQEARMVSDTKSIL